MNYTSLLNGLKDKPTTLDIDKTLYSKSTLLKACYKFTNSFYIFIEPSVTDSSKYKIYFQLKDINLKVEDLIGKFTNELLDQELRTLILSETQKVRDAIVTKALLSGQPNDN